MKKRNRDSAFALILVLFVVSLLGMSLLSWSLLVHDYSVGQKNEFLRDQAKRNALLALKLASVQLNKHCQEDTVVTFGNTGLSQDHYGFTGCWNTGEGAEAGPVWLVSNEDPESLHRVKFAVGADNTPVRVARSALNDSDGMGYWVVDEGMKSAWNPNGQEDEVESNWNPETRVWDDAHWLKSMGFIEESEKWLRNVQSVRSLKNLQEDEEDHSTVLNEISLKKCFLKTDTIRGGFKKNLYDLNELDVDTSDLESKYGVSWVDSQLLEFIQAKTDRWGQYQGEDWSMDKLDKSLEGSFRMNPIITEFLFSFGIASTQPEANGVAQWNPVSLVGKVYMDLWNPYTRGIRISEENDILVRIENLPQISIWRESDSGNSISKKLEDLEFSYFDDRGSTQKASREKYLKAGMVFHATLPQDNRTIIESGDSRQYLGDVKSEDGYGTFIKDLGFQIYGARNDDYRMRVEFQEPVRIVFSHRNSEGKTTEFYRHQLEGYSDFVKEYRYDWADRRSWFKRVRLSDAGWGMGKSSLEEQGYAMGIYFRMLDEQNEIGLQDLTNWLSKGEFRHPEVVVDLSSWHINNAWDSEIPYEYLTNPSTLNFATVFREDDFFCYSMLSKGRRDRIARVFDLPSDPVKGIGMLAFHNFIKYPSFSIGSEWGGELNEVYDRFFFSENRDVHSNLYQKMGLNVNSLSVPAWAQLLSGSLFEEFKISTELEDESRVVRLGAVSNSWKNHSHSLGVNVVEQDLNPSYQWVDSIDDYSTTNHSLNGNLQHSSFIQGSRSVEPNWIWNGESQGLAVSLVEEILKERSQMQRPFFSVQEFVNSGILQKAIDRVVQINDRRDGLDGVVRYSPMFLSQRVIINQIAKYLFSRSDTFKVRVYGDVMNPISKDRASHIYGEALFQRELINGGEGRVIKQKYFRWLEEDEL